MAMPYTVCTCKDGKPWKITTVMADNEEEAISEGWAKFRNELEIELDYVTAS